MDLCVFLIHILVLEKNCSTQFLFYQSLMKPDISVIFGVTGKIITDVDKNSTNMMFSCYGIEGLVI